MRDEKIKKSEEEWEKDLTPEQYEIMRKKGTEMAFSGKYWNTKEKGMFTCAGCGAELFSSDTKFDSGTGWPSFDQALPGAVEYHEDTVHGMTRTEARLPAHEPRGSARSRTRELKSSTEGHSLQGEQSWPSGAEVVCARCGGHLGHVFDDGPARTTGKRYCINSACLNLKKPA